MNKADVTALMSSVAAVVKEFVDNAVGAVSSRVDRISETAVVLESRFAALPEPDNGAPGASAFQIACLCGFRGSEGEWLESLHGKDAVPVDIPAIVAQIVAQIPAPVPGKAVEVDYDRLAALVTATVGAAIAALPAPKPGKDADMAEVRRVLDELVIEATVQIPGPEPVDYERIEFHVKQTVAEAMAAIPAPEVVEPVDPAVLRALISTEVVAAVAGLPKPEKGEPGKNADAELVRAVVAELLPALVDNAEAALCEHLNSAVAALPKAKDGEPGKNAEPIHPDTVALMVVTEVQKAVDKAVASLPRPKDGDRGRDAIECEPLLSIDEAKSYPRGTYAAHRGGTIRSFRKTDAIGAAGLLAAGWAVMQNGIESETEITSEDGRQDWRCTKYTDGTELVRTIARAVVIDRGVWREGVYAKGDGTTFGGSFWIAQRDTLPTEKPGESDAWRLSVKRGRDGADAKGKL